MKTSKGEKNPLSKVESARLFKVALENTFTVLQNADKDVLTTPIPVDFLEKDPQLICASYRYLKFDKTTTITEKVDTGAYRSPYQFYHDIRLASAIQINDLELGSKPYVAVDRFYKLSTELFLRECFRLRLTIVELQEKRDSSVEKEDEESSFEAMLEQDFDSISSIYSASHTELYVTLTQNNVPLFTSLNNRSSLDERETILPEAVTLSKVIPNMDSERAQPLSTLSQYAPREQNSTTQILSRFLHPNWYSLPTAKWLESSDLQCFAPVVDEVTAVVSAQDKGRLWLEHIGYKQLQKLREQPYDAVQALNGEHDEDMKDDMEEDEDEDLETDVAEVDNASVKLTKEDYFNIHEWSAYNAPIEDDEIEAWEEGREQEYLTTLLKRLQSLRKERFEDGLSAPTDEENEIHFRCFRLLKDIVLLGGTAELRPSPLLPTEQFIYTGTLPVPQQNTQTTYRKKYKTRTR